ncbi:hypothetical protein PTTG_02257 [Puccinia triticina 1-1 BBBD Race 1]|uniref:Uncharacterized protein n=1 Tax=Puccinia triticina (isolate 1-1 / race 1 (BBBD)) TaxID=630390 RepID=A0A180GHX3_PUCT1|nr:hypothetical protein PTTG_02257 [Puccinia triticina 1-1 BBBD Race 1]
MDILELGNAQAAAAAESESESEDTGTSSRKNQRRAEWARGKLSRAQPSENWDDDFLFGSLAPSAESLPLPHTTTPTPTQKPPGSQPPRKQHQPKNTFSTSRSSPARNRPPLPLPPASAPPTRGQSADGLPKSRPTPAQQSSSAGFGSPSSSLSMTDDSRADWSLSSGDHSARSRAPETSFNTETELTEPDIDLDWPPPEQQQQQQQQHYKRAHILPHISNSHAHSHNNSNNNNINSSINNIINRPSSSSSSSNFANQYQPRRQSTATTSSSSSIQPSKSKKTFLNNNNNNNNPSILSPSATSSTSSIGYYKSNCSDLSLNSPTAVYSHPSLADPRHPRQPPIRASSCSSTCSVNLGYEHSGSESYDPATSGTETDGISDQFTPDNELYSTPSSSDPTRNTPTVSQRSRKQALYTRPPYVSPSPGSSLSGSISTSTLNASEASLDSRIAGLSLNTTTTATGVQSLLAASEDERSTSAKNPSRRRFRKKRPSTLLLNKAAGSSNGAPDRSPTSALSHRASTVLASICPQPGDLAFAADSDDEERRQSRSNNIIHHRQPHPAEPRKRTEPPPPSRTPPRVPLSGYRALNTRSRSTINRPHTSMQVRNENKQCLSPPDTTSDEGSAKIFKPKRPLSFTALFSRGSANGACPPPPNPPPIKTTNPNQLSRSCFGHRYSTSIDSTAHRLGTSPNSHTSNDSILSRVRRLSSRPAPSTKNSSPASPTRKRFSLAGDTSSRRSLQTSSSVSSGKVMMATPLKAFRAANDKFSTALKYNRRQTSQSDSFVSDVTLTALDTHGTVRARRPSSRASCSNSSVLSSTQPSLTRKFSMRKSNKSSINEPDLCHSPTDSHIDHDLASSSSQSRFPSRRTLSSKPPKSNPALRARAEANAQLHGYQFQQPDYAPVSSSHAHPAPPGSQSPPTDSLDLSPTSSAWGARYPYNTRVLSNHMVPYSEPLPTPFSDGEHDLSNHLVHISNLPNPTNLTRSNSMGELRIPSRITSQQGRLQTELNQVKEFARGIEELKSMRRTYRKMLRATHRPQSFSNADETDSDSDLHQEPDLPAKQEDSASGSAGQQVSPGALDRVYSVIQKIQEEYKEWWTCCNVLIDLGEGSTDPRTKFTSDRVRAITAYSQDPSPSELDPLPAPTTTDAGKAPQEAPPGVHKHFEILKSMFAPDGSSEASPKGQTTTTTTTTTSSSASSSSSSAQTSPESGPAPPEPPTRCHTPPMALQPEIDLGDKTPISRPVNPAESAATCAPQQPQTPTPAPRKVHSVDLLASTSTSTRTTTVGMEEAGEECEGESRLSEWSETDAAWTEAFRVDRLAPKSAPAVSPATLVQQHQQRPDLPPLVKDKRKAHQGRYSSYQHHLHHPSSSLALGALSQRPRIAAASRIGISGIKDFLRVLKARVHAEEKWPIKRTTTPATGASQPMAAAATGDGGEGRSTSSSVRAQKTTNAQASGKKAGGGSLVVRTGTTGRTEPVSRAGLDSLGPPLEPAGRAGGGGDGAESVSSSEEECWDELFGFSQNNTTTSTSTSASLDLALPAQMVGKKKLAPYTPASPGTAEQPRLALSSERMPQLLSYLNVVKEMCAGCLEELKSQTV